MADKYRMKFYEVSALQNLGIKECIEELFESVIMNREVKYEKILNGKNNDG